MRKAGLGGVIAALLLTSSGCFEPGGVNPDSDTTGTGGSTSSAATGSAAVSSAGGSSSSSSGATSVGSSTTDVATSGSTDTSGTSSSSESGQPEGCPAAHECIEPAPGGWDGPIALAEAPAINPDAECPAEYPSATQGARDGLMGADATCTCSCADPSSVTCPDATLERWNQGVDPGCAIPGNAAAGNCGGAADNTVTVPSDGTCSAPIFGGLGLEGSWSTTLPNVSGGSCDAAVDIATAPASWSTRATACGGAILGGMCDGGNICAPNPPAPFSSLLCVARAGDNACPAGPYSDRRLRFRDFTDDRGCEACTCGDAAGPCGGTMLLYGQSNCTGNLLDGDPVAACTVHGCLVRGAEWEPDLTASSCAPSEGVPNGGLQPTDPITFCCLES